MKNLTVFFLYLLSNAAIQAQNQTSPAPRLVDFSISPVERGYRFSPVPPPLQQKAGAPEAFWTYYWEFGDGSFSFEQNPVHMYGAPDTYNPILEATAHYDDGDKPKGKSKKLLADRTGIDPGGLPTVFDSSRMAIQMKASRQARANEDLVCIISYRNLGSLTTDGRLHFFFNERKFPVSHFALDSARTYFQERVDDAVSQNLPTLSSPSEGWTLLHLPPHTGAASFLSGDYPPPTELQNMLDRARSAYKGEKIWRFYNLQSGEKRNLFLALHGTAQMLQDTNAFVHLEAVFAPFDPLIPPERFELEFEIVSSHDPNAILVSDSRVNYRHIGKKKLDYKVKFQNNGEGPASTVEVKVEIPEGLDMKQMRPVEWYPKCPLCAGAGPSRSCLDTLSTKEGLVFTFRNIFLPGSRQEGVDDRDSTKGFVKYRIEAERGMPKRSFRSRAKITFDKNPPIYTNYTRTRFKMGLSPGVKVGYGFQPDFSPATDGAGETEPIVQEGYAFFGLSLSPFKSWRVYPQVELLSGIKGRETSAVTTASTDTIFDLPDPTGIKYDLVRIDSVTTETSHEYVSFEVPVLLRKNFSKFIGAGIGASALVQFSNERTSVKERHIVITELLQGLPGDQTSDKTFVTTTKVNSRPIRYTVFGDITIGSVRKGLNLDLRAGALMGRKKKLTPFAQLALEFKF